MGPCKCIEFATGKRCVLRQVEKLEREIQGGPGEERTFCPGTPEKAVGKAHVRAGRPAVIKIGSGGEGGGGVRRRMIPKGDFPITTPN